ncbi:MAG: threonine synthase [Anaerolineales bacterium]
MKSWPGVIAAFRPWIDLPEEAPAITLLEGNTPLIPVPSLAEAIGAEKLFVKYEGLNPTGSFKDRGMTVAISQAVNEKAEAVICASTGNTAASAAAYATRAGIRAFVLIPEGKVAGGKLAGAIAYGARVLQIQGSFDAALELVQQVANKGKFALVNSINPYRLEGQKTAAFEIADALNDPPDWLALPVGNAGNITAYWMGFQALRQSRNYPAPRILGVQAAGAAPLVHGRPVEQPETVATAIRIGKPARGDQALAAAEESSGRIMAVSDDQLLAAQRLLAAEGIWVEPASAAGVAGLISASQADQNPFQNACVVAVCTGHGLKDPDVIASTFQAPERIKADADSLLEALDQ